MTRRPHRRAVGPAGAHPVRDEPAAASREDDAPGDARPPDDAEDERLRADRPPHHDRGV